MKNKKSLVWFRNNLRLADNEALYEASSNSEQLIMVYILDARHWQESPIKLRTSSDKKLTFLWDSIMALKKSVEAKGGSLLLKKGNTEEVIAELFDEYNFDAVYTTIESGVYEERELENVENYLIKKGVSTYTFAETTLYHPDDIPWPINKLPAVFTQFRKENEKQTPIRALINAPEDLSHAVGEKLTYKPHDFNISIDYPPEKSVLNFKGGEQEALNRLNYYFWETDLVQTYKKTRNGLLGGDYSAKFSPYLALGCISPRTIYFELKKYEKERKSNQSTYWIFFELAWRDYFHFIMKKHGNQLFSAQGIKEEGYEWSHSEKDFQKWSEGKTGVPFVDANMRELNETGFMSNRGRQNVASFLTHDLNIDWRWGAWYFERQLLDYDVASNWGNWAYVAGVGNDPRENRYFNILSQAKKYDPKGEYIKYWLPSLSGIEGFNAHKVGLLNGEIRETHKEIDAVFFEPMIDMKKWDY
ncbi:DASH family cryptochrome [Marivirga atlantica]|jgi:deoxyribodipyrimidine photo-lyase|uniref:Cryptochrome DASH n=1 Tax=Marivirga atlantica TaxID=1548457 RepID=A0A937DIH4_9BACT|nr:DASH family cryptochrome [Marivirga atlantica]MBL0764181.1 DASH family cryptochrome [Marivirga atlantica]